jgi:hypothetical protein
MGLGSDKEREITYKIGWKRGKITISPNKPSYEKDQQAMTIKPGNDHAEMHAIHRLNIDSFWKSANLLPHAALLVLLWVFPVLTFTLSLWLVHLIMIQSK